LVAYRASQAVVLVSSNAQAVVVVVLLTVPVLVLPPVPVLLFLVPRALLQASYLVGGTRGWVN
jgi:hypothetical protein